MITIKNQEEIKIMREGGRILAAIFDVVRGKVQPGVTTKYLDELADKLIKEHNVLPSFKGYRGFPAVICASLNNEIVHGVPSDRILKEGDILSLDCGILYRGFHIDKAVTLPVGSISQEAQKLINITRIALDIGMESAKAGNRLGDIGYAIQKYVEEQGFNVVRDLAGHGIGKNLHEDPLVLNYGKPGTGPKLKTGMTLALEPMVTEGDWHIVQGKDGFAFETKDGKLSAHFEDTIAVTEDSATVLTK